MKLRPWLPGIVYILLMLPLPGCKPSMQVLTQLGQGTGNEPVPSPVAPQVPAPKTAQEIAADIFRQVNPAVVTIYCGREIGSGSIVTPKGLILTNKHVVWSSNQISVKMADGKTYTAWLKAIDPRYDLALIQIEPTVALPTVPMVDGVKTKPGETVYAIGSPKGKAGTFTTGTFTKTNQHGSLQTSKGLLQPGNSGGPLLNTQGKMIGVNKGLLPDGSGLATSVSAVKTFLERSQKRGIGQ